MKTIRLIATILLTIATVFILFEFGHRAIELITAFFAKEI